jgi:hypothetical protein
LQIWDADAMLYIKARRECKCKMEMGWDRGLEDGWRRQQPQFAPSPQNIWRR